VTQPPDDNLAPPPGGWPDVPVARTAPPRPRRAARASHRGRWVAIIFILIFAAGCAAAAAVLWYGR
jgi:hypothetical protein